MSKTIQIRNVPGRIHRELVRRARSRGKSLSGYILEILEHETLEHEISRPPRQEVFERVARREPVQLGRLAADLIREERTL